MDKESLFSVPEREKKGERRRPDSEKPRGWPSRLLKAQVGEGEPKSQEVVGRGCIFPRGKEIAQEGPFLSNNHEGKRGEGGL